MLLNSPRKALILYGPPKSGKTTLVRLLFETLSKGFKVAGFYTEEIKENGVRKGFVLKVFAPWIENVKELPLALKKSGRAKPRIGKYQVLLENLDTALQLLQNREGGVDLWIIDEIGKMEILSQKFCNFVRGLFQGKVPLVATLGVSKQGFMGEVCRY